MTLYGLINLYVLYRKRNIDLLVSHLHFALKRNLVMRKCRSRLAGLARQSRLHGKFSARLENSIPARQAEIFPCNRKVDF